MSHDKMNDLQPAMTASVWKDLPPNACKELRLDDFATPTAPLPTLVVVGRALTDRIAPDATAGEKRSGKALLDACELGSRAGEYNRLLDRRVVDTKPARLKVVRLASGLFEILGVLASAPVEAVAETAARLRTEVFGDDFRPGTYKSRPLYQRMCEVEAALLRNPALRQALEGVVPAAVVEAMLVAHRELGEHVRRRGALAEADPAVDLGDIATHLRQRVGQYVVNVLATADPEQPETVARALRLLAPLTELRAELTKERSLRARRAATRHAEEEEATERAQPPEANPTASANSRWNRPGDSVSGRPVLTPVAESVNSGASRS